MSPSPILTHGIGGNYDMTRNTFNDLKHHESNLSVHWPRLEIYHRRCPQALRVVEVRSTCDQLHRMSRMVVKVYFNFWIYPTVY